MKNRLILVLLVALVAQSAAPAARAQLAIDDYPNRRAFILNEALRRLYLEVRDVRGATAEMASQIERLNGSLAGLRALDAPIAAGLRGEGAEELIARAKIGRALAWVHAWATFGQLAYQASRPAPGEGVPLDSWKSTQQQARTRLLAAGAGSESALTLLAETYAQIAAAEGGGDDPLRKLLAGSRYVSILLEYAEPWRPGERPAGIAHSYFIPSTKDLLGAPADRPVPDAAGRHMLSVWGLINLQVDTWHALALDPETLNPPPAALAARELGYGDLARWLGSLTHQRLGLLATENLERRAAKLSAYLAWRESHQTQEQLDAFVRQLYVQRTTSGGDLAAAFGGLLTAARPEPGDEYLYDAAYWARYMYLLSLRRPRQAFRDASSENAFLDRWKSLGAGTFALDRKAGGPRGGALRWNQEPPSGSLPALLSDVTNAASALFTFERETRAKARNQFTLVTAGRYVGGEPGKPEFAPFATRLRDHAKAIDDAMTLLYRAYRLYLSPYYTPVSPAPGVAPPAAAISRLQVRTPVRLLDGGDPLSVAFRSSASVSERDRALADLETFSSEVRAGLALQGAIRDSFAGAEPKVVAGSLGSLSQAFPFSAESPHALPSRSAADYKRDLAESVDLLNAAVLDLVEARRNLAAAYRSKREALEGARSDLRAARVGERLAAKAKEIAEVYQRVASLEAEEDDLRLEITRLEQEGWNSSLESANRKLASVERVRDLAAARVDALRQAGEKAEEVIQSETKELIDIGNQYAGLATQLEKKRHAAAILAVVQAAVGVIGAALAPFTGGASAVVATIVNKGVDTYRIIKNTNWKDANAALEAVGQIGANVGAAIEAGITQFGSDKVKKTLEEAKVFLATQKQKLTDASASARQLLEGISKLATREQIAGAAALLAAGMPAVVQPDGKIKFDFGEQKIVFKNPALAKDLRGLLDAGGVLVNDIALRNADIDLRGLPQLAPDALPAKLAEAIELASKQLPPGLFKKWQNATAAELADAEQKYRAALTNLKERVVATAVPPEELRVLAEVLAGGWVVVSDEGAEFKVSALAPPIRREAEQFERRLEAYRAEVLGSALQKLLDRFSARREKIIADGQTASNANSPEALTEIATRIPGYIEETKADIAAIAAELRDARAALDDARASAEIAYYDTQAVRAFAAASAKRVEQAEVGVRRAAEEKQRALLVYEESLLKIEMSDETTRAAASRVSSLEIDVERTYESCLEAGFDPLVAGREDEPLRPPPFATARALFSPYEHGADVEGYAQWVLGRAADDALGLVRWHSMVWRSGDPQTGPGDRSPSEQYAALLSTLAYDSPKKAAGELRVIGDAAFQAFTRKASGGPGAPGRLAAALAEVQTDAKRKVFWIHDMTPRERDVVLERMPRRLAELMPNVIGVIKVRLDPDLGPDPGNVPYFSLGPKRNAFYADATELKASCDGCANLKFVALPPRLPAENLGSLSVGISSYFGGDQPNNQILTSEALFPVVQDWKQKLNARETLELTGALGEWEFLILDMTDPSAKTPQERKQQAAALAAVPFRFIIAYFSVPPGVTP